ncbi:mycothiol system anti-sigma-R factor [Motilibacter rhizosphaerae]|uniref:Mycothiol system anti-sigma-R factor n=1 Tax=Motilibacter rhizosphaerae TaxID=598652 RepID=A0A4Q7NPE4_9ACTN|nr:mycothiol system anti-sigma-R factor [Motilibacter rhizosphaerae]RZS87139.1 mycothiol system anti-sigma-R factor [Motilibacter rhizosphaerae]
MSCGNHHETPCVEVLAQVYSYIDGELGGSDCATVKHHLDECSPCLREFGIEEEVKALVRRSCADPAPTELRAKVLLRIRQVSVELGPVE